jgi:hypothetical protein
VSTGSRVSLMWKHLAAIATLILLVVVCMFRPFLPGSYDPLAVTREIVVYNRLDEQEFTFD